MTWTWWGPIWHISQDFKYQQLQIIRKIEHIFISHYVEVTCNIYFTEKRRNKELGEVPNWWTILSDYSQDCIGVYNNNF